MIRRFTHAADDIGRMPYALPPGMPALQSDRMLTRRWLLATVAGSLAAATTATLLVTRSHSSDSTPSMPAADPLPPAAPLEQEVIWALDLARKPVSDMRRYYSVFLAAVERSPQHEELWRGVERLALDSFANDEESLRVARRVYRTLSMKVAPAGLAELRVRVRERLGR